MRDGGLIIEVFEQLPQLRRFSIAPRFRALSGTRGERSSTRKGPGIEFADHREYTVGDDIRVMDWKAFARTQRPVVKEFRMEEDLGISLMIDTTGSMGVPDAKGAFVKRVAVALAYVGLNGYNRVAIVPFDDEELRFYGWWRGKNAIGQIVRRIERIEFEGTEGLNNLPDYLIRRSRDMELGILITDMLGAKDVKRILGMVKHFTKDAVVVLIYSSKEIKGVLEGTVLIEDSETGEFMRFEGAELKVRDVIGVFEQKIKEEADRVQIPLVSVDVDAPLKNAFEVLVRNQIVERC